MKWNSSLFRMLGIVAAIVVPAVVVAQQAPFADGTRLSAAPLNDLDRRIDGLEADNTMGSTVLATTLSTVDGTLEAVSFTARADGIISLVPSGGSFQTATTVVRTSIGGTQQTLVRATAGNSASLPVRNAQAFTIEATVGASLAVNINVYWTPLRGNDPGPSF
jgi:hypothetical protein